MIMASAITAPQPLLVIDDVHCDEDRPHQVVAQLRFAGHPVRVVLDFSGPLPGLIEHVEMPDLLALHHPSQKAVLQLMTRVHAGEEVQCPLDLSNEVRESSSLPSPFEPVPPDRRLAMEREADLVQLQIVRIERSADDPARHFVELYLQGERIRLEVELIAGTGSNPVMRWIRGPDPQTLTAPQRYAILRAISKHTEPLSPR